MVYNYICIFYVLIMPNVLLATSNYEKKKPQKNVKIRAKNISTFVYSTIPNILLATSRKLALALLESKILVQNTFKETKYVT